MDNLTTISLGGRAINVAPLTLASLRRIGPRLGRCIAWSNLRLQDGGFPAFVAGADEGAGDAVEIISAATGLSVAEVQSIPASLAEAAEAVVVIGVIAGVVKPMEPEQSGEAEAGTSIGG